MGDAETRALRRAVTVLIALSAVRWGWSQDTPGAAPRATDLLGELLDSTRGAVSDAERRARPLESGERIDVNRDGAEELDRLPGIGPSTAEAIVEARERLGAFHRADDLLSVRGIGDVTLARISPHLDFGNVSSNGARSSRRAERDRPGRRELIDLNRASQDRLEALPGIARRIVQSRREQPFRTAEDLLRVQGIGPATLAKLRGLVTPRE